MSPERRDGGPFFCGVLDFQLLFDTSASVIEVD